MKLQVLPGVVRPAQIAAPPSKSLAHRALVCAGLARGMSTLHGIDYSQDILATLGGVEQACAKVQRGPDWVRVEGRGGFATLVRPVWCGESGSTLRFFIPILSLTGQKVCFTGTGRLFARPLDVYRQIFEKQRLTFVQTDSDLTIKGALSPGDYVVPGDVSSQFVSGLLFVLPMLDRDSTLRIEHPFESRSYVDLTLSVLRDFGVQTQWASDQPNTLYIPGRQEYQNLEYHVEGDYSQAAFFAVLGALRGGVTLTGLRPDSRQGDRVILEILARCGADMTRRGDRVQVEKSILSGCDIDLADCPDLGPILMVMACFCQGETRIRNADRLRLKESDRIAAMETELSKFGAQVSSSRGEIVIRGGGMLHQPAPLDGHNDHRVVMSMAVCAAAAGVPAVIQGAEAVRKSWPDFFAVLQQTGVTVEAVENDG